MAKVLSLENGKYQTIHCPGCGYSHTLRVRAKTDEVPSWEFNGDVDKPTFTPSLLVWASRPEARCHSFITNGQIQFLDDCFHELKGQTVELPDYED